VISMDESGIEILRRQAVEEEFDVLKCLSEQAKQEELRHKRFEPFQELAQRNIAVADRAKVFIGLRQQSDIPYTTHKSPIVVFSDPAGGMPGLMGYIESSKAELPGGETSNYRFRFYSANQKGVSTAKEDPFDFSVFDYGKFSKEESCYPIITSSEDGIRSVSVRVNLDYRHFSPIGAINLAITHRRMQRDVSSLESAMGLFETKALEATLNPNLARVIESKQQFPD
jgi:hypothetical protein